jgi:hypothetical protein
LARNKAEISEEELKLRLGDIIYVARRLHNDEDYRNNLVRCINNAATAGKRLGELHDGILRLEFIHMDAGFQLVLSAGCAETESVLKATQVANGRGQLLWLIKFMSGLVESIGISLSLITQQPETKRGRGYPALPYHQETCELLQLWLVITGKAAVTPKGKAKGHAGKEEGVQDSTEFIRLCLEMIDPKMTVSNAHTLIKNAMKTKRGVNEFLVIHGGKISSIAGLLRAFASVAEAENSKE